MTGRTSIELTWIEGRIERWLRFGPTVGQTVVNRSRRTVTVDPGTVFAFVRWASNDYGTVKSQIDVLRAPRAGQSYSTVPFVTPGGVSLLRLSGWPKVEAALLAIDQVEAKGIAPEDVCPDHWRHVHNRVGCNLPARRYTTARHEAWLRRQALAS